MVWTDTKMDVSDMCWCSIDSRHDEMIVCFLFHPSIYLYNFSTATDPIQEYLLGSERNGGHRCITYAGKNGEFILAGSTTGLIRMWSVNKTSKVTWAVSGDPSVTFATGLTYHGSPVVGLLCVPDSTDLFVSVTENGIIGLWDISSSSHTVASFGSTARPSCLRRINVSDCMSITSDLICVNNVQFYPSSSTELCLSFTLSDPHLVNITTSRCVSIGKSNGSKFHITKSMLEVLDARRVTSPAAGTATAAPQPTNDTAGVTHHATSVEIGGVAHPPVESTSDVLSCGVAFPCWPGNNVREITCF